MKAVITGVTSGIGLATSQALAQEGYDIIGIGRAPKKLKTAEREIEALGRKFEGYVCDVSSRASVERVCKEIRQKHKTIDVLVNNAGVLFIEKFDTMDVEKMETTMRTNFWGAVYFIKGLSATIPKGGTIVNVASIVGRIGVPNWAAYCASKFAVVGLSESLYYEFKKKGIHVALICPPGVNTRLYRSLARDKAEHMTSTMMNPERVAAAVVKSIKQKIVENEITFKDTLTVFVKNLFPRFFRGEIERRFGR